MVETSVSNCYLPTGLKATVVDALTSLFASKQQAEQLQGYKFGYKPSARRCELPFRSDFAAKPRKPFVSTETNSRILHFLLLLFALSLIAPTVHAVQQTSQPKADAVQQKSAGKPVASQHARTAKASPGKKTTKLVPAFPIRSSGGGVNADGGESDVYVEILLSAEGMLEIASAQKAHRSFLGSCFRHAVYFFDEKDKLIGRYGMADDQALCVNGRLSPAGPHDRNDSMVQWVPKKDLPRIRRVSIQTFPTKKAPVVTLGDVLKVGKDVVLIAVTL